MDNPEHEDREVRDQIVLSYLLSSYQKTCSSFFGQNHNWSLDRNQRRLCLAKKSKNRILLALANTRGQSICFWILRKDEIHGWWDGSIWPSFRRWRIGVHSQIPRWHYIPLVSNICAKESITVSKLFNQLLNFETHVGLVSYSICQRYERRTLYSRTRWYS